MNKKTNLLYLVVVTTALIIVLLFVPLENTYFGVFFDKFSKVDWTEVKDRDIVKNSIPIILLEEINGKCKVYAHNFNLIIDHQYFIRSDDLSRELNYDRENETLTLPCDMLEGEKSRLHIWYVVDESPKHSKKYQYFITEWNSTMTG